MREANTLIRRELRRNSDMCGVRLSDGLENHLALTMLRYLSEGLDASLITVRLMHAGDTKETPSTFRKIGDDCLVTCALFPEFLQKRGGTLVHYAGVGRTAYDSAGLTEAAYGFGLMLDVLSAFREDKAWDVLDRARAGSKLAQHETRNNVVVPFVGKPRARF